MPMPEPLRVPPALIPGENGAPVVFCDRLRKAFGDLVAVADIAFRVEKGECFGILGPNGAGKTTTVRMIYGFSPRTAGTLRVFGLDVGTFARAVKGRIGVCQQENTLDPDLSVRENLTVFARFFNIPQAEAARRAEALLRFMALDHRQEARALELSGGMVRRLVLARALINEPDLLILDEPTTGLDPQSRHQVWERLEKLKADGLTILLTTHYMEEATRLCDRLIIVDHGRILIEGKPRELIASVVGSEVIEIPDPGEALLAFVRKKGADHERFGQRLILYSRDRNAFYHEVDDRFCGPGCVQRGATLEDVFLRLTGRELRE
jgi:lipooligosaccharide transport system ATP-binding protein